MLVTADIPANVWRVEFEDWVDDSLHWNAPSYVDLNLVDGSYVFFATHIANMRREGFLDQGIVRHLHVTLSFYTEAGCLGAPFKVETRNVLPAIGYKREYDNYRHEFPGTPEFVQVLSEAQCVRSERSWEVGL